MLEWIGLGGWIVSSFTTGAAGWLLAKKLGPLRPSHGVRQSVARIGPFFTLTLNDQGSRFARNENRRSGDQPVALPSRSRIATAYEYTSPRAKARQTMFAQMPPLNELREEVDLIRRAERDGDKREPAIQRPPLRVALEPPSARVLANFSRAIERLGTQQGEEAPVEDLDMITLVSRKQSDPVPAADRYPNTLSEESVQPSLFSARV